MSQDKEFLAALDSFGAAQQGTGANVAATANIEICVTYNKVKPILTGLLPFIKAIPVYGPKVYAAISALMQALNALCPSTTASLTSAKQTLEEAGLLDVSSLDDDVAETLAQMPTSSLKILAQAQQTNVREGNLADFGSNGF
jgi:hypothetical protein